VIPLPLPFSDIILLQIFPVPSSLWVPFEHGTSFHCHLNMINLSRHFLKLRTRVSCLHELRFFSAAQFVWTAGAGGKINQDRKSLATPFRIHALHIYFCQPPQPGVVFGQLLIFRNRSILPWSSLQLRLRFMKLLLFE
jgi:hypothetical protein